MIHICPLTVNTGVRVFECVYSLSFGFFEAEFLCVALAVLKLAL